MDINPLKSCWLKFLEQLPSQAHQSKDVREMERVLGIRKDLRKFAKFANFYQQL